MHYTIGNIGHLGVIISFVAAWVAAFAYWQATRHESVESAHKDWKQFARLFFYVHSAAIVMVIVALFFIIYNHYYEYHYAWGHSSRNLPVHYMISCFWEGQEGSFLLWIFWHALLGVIIIHTNKTWETPVMTIFALVQGFLASMILGVLIGDVKIGSSPFILMRDAMANIPIFQMNPEYIPQDGRGLNPLLQNYWMVIHPPTLFLGFAATLIPFSYAIAGLWQKRYQEWLRPALPWALFGVTVLGIGILMGGYWAYETLNFGGYWNWDPVENAVYIPWLVMVAAIHTMISHRKNQSALKSAMILSITTFVLVLYATFLTRSGILGNASVHSFTDLGLSGQLLVYLLAFVLLSVVLLVWRWKEIPTTEKEASTYSREFWIFIGVVVLCLASFQVLAATSIPVFNKILEALGIDSQAAPPADPVPFYTQWQMWFSIFVAILSGVGQYFWWEKIDKSTLVKALTTPLVIALLASSIIIALGVTQWDYIILVTCSIFSIAANGIILAKLLKGSLRMAGGAIAHIGIAMMLLGILFSSGYSRIISLNTTGMVYNKDFSTELNRDNIMLWRNTPTRMSDFTLTYKGDCIEVDGFPTYVKKEFLRVAPDPYKAITRADLVYNDKTFFKKGDTVRISPENTYYAVEYHQEGHEPFVLFPRAQVNPNMGLMASPDIKRFWNKDLYTHVSSVPDPEQEKKWSETEQYTLAVGDTFIANDFIAQLVDVQKVNELEGTNLGANDAAVKAIVRIMGKDQNYIAEPVFAIKDGQVGRFAHTIDDLGVRLTLLDINPQTGKFTIGLNTSQKDWIILKAVEKPLINVLWIGTFVLVIGFSIAIVRRYKEFRLMRDKGQE